jgi:hypothetical protein
MGSRFSIVSTSLGGRALADCARQLRGCETIVVSNFRVTDLGLTSFGFNGGRTTTKSGRT